ncbi:ectopic P granules protein 5 homolog [Adelges cooleyi]|uniref:ectopic P granules protein 5 homolog n=1 Tax=Adelges cooleyi TaxID=133065 RepID=UPI00217F834C|nr:ectopic P granules protein 5 homolog [Adelges cooleyi]
MERQRPRNRAPSKVKRSTKVKVEQPEPVDDDLLTTSVDDVANALYEAFNDICESNDRVAEETDGVVVDRSCQGGDDQISVDRQPPVALGSSADRGSIVLPSSIPCSVGSLPTPCAPALDDFRSRSAGPSGEVPNFEPLDPLTDEQLAAYYRNSLLSDLHGYTEDFNRAELNNLHACVHPLYALLEDYGRARLKLETAKTEIDESRTSYETHVNHIWTLEPARYTEYGKCKDGYPVSATKEYQISRFNQKALDNLLESLQRLRTLVNGYYGVLYDCQMIKEEIDYYLHLLCRPFSTISADTPVGLFFNSDVRSPDGKNLQPCIENLKAAVSVLFVYQRKPIRDQVFVQDTRQLLRKVIGVLLRVASWKDHVFILNHILRCPSGVGKWASDFVQIPLTDANYLDGNFHLDCMITSLAVVLLPVRCRENFLEQVYKSEEVNEAIWVVVDSEGEDECSEDGRHCLRESDIVALLSQIPFSALFKKMISTHVAGDQGFRINQWDEPDLLRLIAVGSVLIKLFQTGLKTYCSKSVEYKQFSKRLGHLLQDVVNYVTDTLEEYTCHKYVSARVQTEYDAFLDRAVKCLYGNVDRTTWQYLVMLPFSHMSSQTSKDLFQYLLHIKSDPSECSLEELTDCVANSSDDECYYLLTTLNNMALSRDMKDIEFISSVTTSLFKIGFVNNSTKEKCQKTCRALLSNLTDKHPFLISDILSVLKKHIDEVGSGSMYLFKELPLTRWRLTADDLLYVENLILNNPIASTQNTLSRHILTKLFSECNETDINDLMLTKDMHGRIAIIVVKAVLKHAPITVDETSAQYLVHSIKQLVQIKSNEQAFRIWAWKLLYSLKLHLMDLPSLIVRGSLQDISHYLLSVVDIETIDSDLKCLQADDPIALYTAVHVTTAGHCVPVILHKGLDYCYKLLQYKHYTASIACLNAMVPFFFEQNECLLESKKFLVIVAGILADNQSNAKRAMNILTVQGPSEVIVQFNNMIQYQISNYMRYGLMSSHPVLELWTKVVCSIWKTAESDTCVYVLDTIFKNVVHSQSLQWARELLADLINQFSDFKDNATAIGSIFNFMFHSPEKRPLLLPKYPTVLSNCPYYAVLALEAEEWCVQSRNDVWKRLLTKLQSQQGKANIDDALKRVCAELKLPYFSSGHLSLYRWMQYGLEVPCSHPTAFIYWQNFFRLYLQRIPGSQHHGSVGRKFFEGIVNSSYLSKINNKLKECAALHRQKLLSEPNSDIDSRSARFFEACILWLTDVRLLEPTLFIPSLDSIYEPSELTHIINGSNEWLPQLINKTAIEESKIECSKNWIELMGKHVQSAPRIQRRNTIEKDPITRIVNRLKTYDPPSPSPEFTLRLSDVHLITSDILYHNDRLLNVLRNNIKQIVEFIDNVYRVHTVRHDTLDNCYADGIKVLYNQVDSVIRVQAVCDSKFKRANKMTGVKCAGAAEISFQIRETKLNTDVQDVIAENRSELDQLISKTLELSLPSSLTCACTNLNLTTQLLISEISTLLKVGDVALVAELRSSGVKFFYMLLSEYTILKTCPTIEKFAFVILQTVGKVFIMNNENECLHIMNKALSCPEMSNIVVPLFCPSSTSTKTFISAYTNIVQHCNAQYEPIAKELLTKFDVAACLSTKQPLLQERSVLIDHCLSALIMVKQQTRTDYTMAVHELFSEHLCRIMDHDFPEHYGEILLKLLEHSKEGRIYTQVWFYILNTVLAQAVPTTQTNSKRTILLPNMSVVQLRDVARRYATDQRSLSSQQLQETLHLLTTHFSNERLKAATGELYSQYNTYIEPLVCLYAMVGHALIVGTLQTYRGMLANQICEFLVPALVSMFGPWLEPWYEGWNADNRLLKLPWLATDTSAAALMTDVLVECIMFVLDTMPACENVLSFVCQWYVKMYAHMQTTDYVFDTIHSGLAKLSWQRFIPTPVDMDLIMKVMDQFLPQSQSFLANVILEVPWPYVPNIDLRVLLSMFIKLSNQPNMRKDSKIRPLLLEAQKLSWHQIDGETYENILSWFTSKYDPLTVLQLTNEEWCGTDSAVLDLLKSAAGYHNADHNLPYTEPMSYKRRIFIRAMVRMFVSMSSRYRSMLGSHYKHIKCSFNRLLDETEMATKHCEEAKLLVAELLALVNQPTGSVLSSLMLQTIQEWIAPRKADSAVMKGMLMATWSNVADQQHKGDILEACLTAWFRNSGNEDQFKWDSAMALVQPAVRLHYQGLAESLMSSGNILTLYVLASKESQNRSLYPDLLSTLVQCLESVKPSNLCENKLPLLWSLALQLSTIEDDYTADHLIRIANAATQLALHKQSWSLFDAIRLQKQTNITPKCRVLCRALAAFIHAQLPENKTSRRQFIRHHENAPGGFSSNDNDFVSSMECLKATAALEALKQDRQFADCNVAIDVAIKDIKGPHSCMKNGQQFVIKLAKCLYTDNFIHRLAPV